MPIKVVAPLREASQTHHANLGDPYPYHSPKKKDPFVPRVFLFASFEEQSNGSCVKH
ncbi:hypothetical protein THOD04_30336 [Vibrio owensii]|uniref:Uncharacterized protein n=1 Tax=Vibrio owensii TaxID=696485 RepID=A0AAU9PY60_9VIBR|nr:hypothetical protein THF1D04_10462 [Vibrio owensii]CAH1588049.1 hypothetical protein THOD04_30336 [Vibrio owensii]